MSGQILIFDSSINYSLIYYYSFWLSERMKKKEKPDENFYKILNDLRGIAVNINQLAKVANTYQYVDDNKYYPLANRVNDMIDDLQKFYLTPTKKK